MDKGSWIFPGVSWQKSSRMSLLPPAKKIGERRRCCSGTWINKNRHPHSVLPGCLLSVFAERKDLHDEKGYGHAEDGGQQIGK